MQTTWERLAQIDPLWAVLSEPDKKGRAWDVDEFFATGQHEIDSLIKDMLARGERIGKYLMKDYWLDIGRPEDYESAEEAYRTHFSNLPHER